MKWARLENNIVFETIDFDPEGKFHPSIIWQEVPDNVDQHWTTDGANWFPPEIPTPVETMDEAAANFLIKKNSVQASINQQFAIETAAIKDGVVQEEIDTFATQEKEALAYQADNTADVPLISGLAAVRGLTVAELAARVLGHAAAYKAAMAQVMGKKHLLEDQVAAALTIEDLEAIEVT